MPPYYNAFMSLTDYQAWDSGTAALLILFLSVLVNLISWLAERHKLQQRDDKRSALVRDISGLKKEAAKYNTPGTYAKSAKCQRMINAKEKQLSLLGEAATAPAWEDRVMKMATLTKLAVAGLSILCLYGRPVARVPPEILVPMQRRLLAMPHGKDFSSFGAIAVLPWLMLCNRAGMMVIRAVLPVKGSHSPVKSSTMLPSNAEAVVLKKER